MDTNIAFLLGTTTDPYGRSVDDYLKFSGTDWETQHDVIQMAFPTKTQSKFHPNQPFLPSTFSVYDAAALSTADLQRARATISLLLHSYMKSLGVEFLIIHRPEFSTSQTSPHWANSHDHNTLRLTRIIDCLGIFEMYPTRDALFEFLVYDIVPNNRSISGATVAFWVAAKENSLDRLR